MDERSSFADLFRDYLELKGVGVEKLSSLIKKRFNRQVSASSMQNWRDGRSKSPRDWQDVVAAAAALDLTNKQTDSLLAASGHPSISQLWKQEKGSSDAFLLINWLMPLPSEKLEDDIALLKEHTEQQRTIQQQLADRTAHMQTEQQKFYSRFDEWGQTQVRNMHPSGPLYSLPPQDISYFIGRVNELSQLEQLLLTQDAQSTGSSGALITGTGGMGKSWLAYRFAHTHLKDFKDGVIALSINDGRADESMQPSTPVTIARRLLQLIDHSSYLNQQGNVIETVLMLLRQKHLLLILDNVENDTTIRGLIPGGNCKVLITTRNRSLLEQVLPDHARIDLESFSPAETQLLLKEFIGQERVTRENDKTTELHELVGGLPLALRIAGSAIKYRNASVSTYTAMLREEKLSLLRTPGSHLSDDPDYSVRASFKISLNFLTEEQKILFACLSACAAEGFSSTLAQVVSDQSESATESGLELLCRLSLLDQGMDLNRFLFHPLLHLFAHELACEENLFAGAEQRHTKHFLDCVQQFRKHSSFNQQDLEKDLAGWLLAARYLPAHLSTIKAFYLAIEPLLQKHGYWEQALELLARRLEIARKQEDFYEIAQTHIQRGQFLTNLARLEDAEGELLAAQSLAPRIVDEYNRQSTLGMALNSLGKVYNRMKKFHKAIPALQQSYNIRKALGDKQSCALVLTSLGAAYQAQHRYMDALKAFQESRAIFEEEGMRDQLAPVLNSLGNVFQDLRRFDEAIEAIQEGYHLRSEFGDKLGEAMSLSTLGGVYKRMGKLDKAAEELEKSVAIERKARTKRGLAMALTKLGEIYQAQQRYDDAMIALQEALSLEERLGNANGQVLVLNSLSRTLLEQNKYKEALNYIQDSFAIAEARRLLKDLPGLVELAIEAVTPLQQVSRAQDYCARALKLAPDNRKLQQLRKQLNSHT